MSSNKIRFSISLRKVYKWRKAIFFFSCSLHRVIFVPLGNFMTQLALLPSVLSTMGWISKAVILFILLSSQNPIAHQWRFSLWRWQGTHCSSRAASQCWSRILRAWSSSRQTSPSTSLDRQVPGIGLVLTLTAEHLKGSILQRCHTCIEVFRFLHGGV